MQSARCTLNGSVYQAQQLTGLQNLDLSQHRHHLVCPECGGPAFYRKESLNGRDACFGARPHASGCSLKAAQSALQAHGQADGYVALMEKSERILVDFGYGAHPSQSQVYQTDEWHSPMNHVGTRSGSDSGATSATHVRLRPLLRLLVAIPALNSSRQWVDVPGIGTFKVADFFVRFERLAELSGCPYLGAFGKVHSALLAPLDGALWLNSGQVDDPSICIPQPLIAALAERFQMGDASDLTEADVLVFGILRTSRNGKKFLVLDDLNHITLVLPDDQQYFGASDAVGWSW